MYKVCLKSMLIGVSVALCACGGGGGGRAPARVDSPDGKVIGSLPEYLFAHVVAAGVRPEIVELAFSRFEYHRDSIRNDRYLSIIDFSLHSREPRLFVVNIASGEVDAIHVAHGVGSDPNNTGVPRYFSNVPNSKRTSLGSYLISEKYYGKYGASMRTDGLEPSNSLARRRAIVMHPSNYVEAGRSKQGRSWGCPAVPYAWIGKLIDRLRGGSFMFAFGVNEANASVDQASIERIMLDPAFVWLNEAEDAPLDGL